MKRCWITREIQKEPVLALMTYKAREAFLVMVRRYQGCCPSEEGCSNTLVGFFIRRCLEGTLG